MDCDPEARCLLVGDEASFATHCGKVGRQREMERGNAAALFFVVTWSCLPLLEFEKHVVDALEVICHGHRRGIPAKRR